MDELSSPLIKKKRGLWSEKNLVTAINCVKNGELSQRQAAETYKIPRRTLRNHLKSGIQNKRFGRFPVLTNEQESQLVERVIKFAKIGMPLTSTVIRTLAYKFCDKMGIKNNFNKITKRAGRDWLKFFLKRNPNVSQRKAQLMNPARAQKLNKPIVRHHFEEVKKLIDELDIINNPERMYNMDEKGCRLTIHHQQKVLAEKGNRRVHMIAHEHAENVTIAMCVNAAGTAIPAMLLFKGKRLKQEFTDNLPPGTIVRMAPKGSMTTSLFIEFIDHLGKYKCPGKCLLIFDGASCHLDYDIVEAAEKNDIVLYCLPSNTTHELQPLDKSVNKSFENYWDQEVMKFMYHNPTKKITKTRFNCIFSKVWGKTVTPNNIVNGFRATGLYPFDPFAISEDAYAPSMLTENLDPALGLAHNNVFSNCQASSDTDATDIEDLVERGQSNENNIASPSLLDIQQELESLQNVCTETVVSEQINRRKLVDYSSSFDSERESHNSEISCHEQTELLSPIAGPSGLNAAESNSSLDSLSLSQINKFIFTKNLPRLSVFDVYSDSSTDEIDKGDKTPDKKINDKYNVSEKPFTDDSDDNIPLNELRNKAPFKTTFKDLLPTPNYATVKSHPRRKAINYKGQKIVKDLFEKKGNINQNKGKDDKTCNAPKTNKKQTTKNKLTTKNKNKTEKITKPKNKQNLKVTKSNTDISDKWFCHGCNEEKEEDMRICKKCEKWYHEECVGLTKDDEEMFICPDCI